ncbi:MAG: hypothetical protein ACTSP9_16440 [Promethearchaeota archaeon]
MKELYELGIVFRGFILVKHLFKEIPDLKGSNDPNKDLRGAFISAINMFAKNAFNNISLEYLESNNILFIFKPREIKASDSNCTEPIILYGLTDKRKKDPDKLVKKFLEKSEPIMESFISKYTNKDFTEIDQFSPFQDVIPAFFD